MLSGVSTTTCRHDQATKVGIVNFGEVKSDPGGTRLGMV